MIHSKLTIQRSAGEGEWDSFQGFLKEVAFETVKDFSKPAS